jgi:hypothetical protein
MLLLTSTSDIITVITDSVSNIRPRADWVDNNAGTITPGRTNTAAITTATTTTIVASPASGVQRNVKTVTLHNEHASASCGIAVQHSDGTNAQDILMVTLLPKETLSMNELGDWRHYDSNGAEYLYSVPASVVTLGIQGTIAETIARQFCDETNTAALTSGTLHLAAVYLTRGQVVSNLSFFSATTAAGTPTNGIFGLFDASRNLLAQTANFTTEAWAANTIKTKALTAAYTVPTSGLYYVGIMITATTVPTLKGATARTGGQLAGTAPILHGNSTTGLTTTLPNPAAAITVGTTRVWGACT